MIIKKLFLRNYRNYDDLEIEFEKKLSIFIGNNAQGKTNILESIYVLAITKSYLGINDKNLIKFGNEASVIKADVELEGVNKNLEIIINELGKKVKINGNEIKKLKDYVSSLNVIIFSPDNIRMVKEGPSMRRKFLNVEISQISNRYVYLMNDYNFVLKQRNQFIKMSNVNDINHTYLDIINDKYVDLAVDIYLMRKKFLEKINSKIGSIYKDITGTGEISIKYVSNIDYYESKDEMKKKFLEKINESLEKEMRYGISLYGPHRDDFNFYLDSKNISLYGSQGQLRMSVLALRLSEIDIFYDYTGNYPIVLLDDIFSELDVNKRNNLIKYISSDIQTIITTTDIEMIDKSLVDNACIYTIDDGKIIDRKDGSK